MAKLVISLNGVNIREYVLATERATIGRNSNNDIVLDEPVVSGEHAAIQLTPEVSVTDLNSTNGTQLNGQPLRKAPLHHNDVLRIGNHELRFIDERVQDFAATMVLAAEQTAVPEARPQAMLKLLNGPRAGEVMPIEKSRTALGKPGVQVAMILRTGAGYELLPVSLASSPIDTRVNGEPMHAEPRLLHNGDEIAIADARLAFILNT